MDWHRFLMDVEATLDGHRYLIKKDLERFRNAEGSFACSSRGRCNCVLLSVSTTQQRSRDCIEHDIKVLAYILGKEP